MNKLFRYFTCITLLLFLGSFSELSAQKVGLRTNALYWATTTPNVALDWRLGRQMSLTIQGSYNPFSFPARTLEDGSIVPRKIKHWAVVPELKYWFCRTFERHYIGLHGVVGSYNAGGVSFGTAADEGLSRYRYRGDAYGVGLSWGYQWALGKRWGLEASIGAGYIYLPYDKYECVTCGDHLGRFARHYLGPTKAEISFVYFLN